MADFSCTNMNKELGLKNSREYGPNAMKMDVTLTQNKLSHFNQYI